MKTKLKLRDKLKLFPLTITEYSDGKKKGLEGEVVYIHPSKRYFVAEFLFHNIPLRESFFFHELEEVPDVQP